MSYDALVASKTPFVCDLCGETIDDGSNVIVALQSVVFHHPEGYEPDEPDYVWSISLDWTTESYYHRGCFARQMQKD